VLENVNIDKHTRVADYHDKEITENTRAAYPLDYIPGAVASGQAGHPKVVIFLTADAFGVLPPISRLTKAQAMYYFLSGYTSKLAGTERGVTEPEATFSTCFGAPFLPLHPSVYAEMLGKKIEEQDVKVYLVNTGWSGGPYGVGQRMKLEYTRKMITAAINGTLENSTYQKDPIFGLEIPAEVPDVPVEVLNPRQTWNNPIDYDASAIALANRFAENFKKYEAELSSEIINAGPNVK
jgi:phosphoenolpyruvate carboxykinase (ATP)